MQQQDIIYCRRKYQNIQNWNFPEPTIRDSTSSCWDQIMNPNPNRDHSQTLTLEIKTPKISDYQLEEKVEPLDEEVAPPAAVSSSRRAASRRKRLTSAQLQSLRKKLETLGKNFVPVPFVPNRTLDVATHEKLLRLLGLWDFVHVEFDRDIRADLVTQLIANYNAPTRSSRIDDLRIMVSRADLARALKLPGKKDKTSVVVGVDSDVEVASEESIAFVEDLVSNWVLLHEDTWILPNEVVNWTRVIKEGHPEKVDWASLIWFMVEKEVLQGPKLSHCYYASHLQCLIKSQRSVLFTQVSEERLDDVTVKLEEGGGSDLNICVVDDGNISVVDDGNVGKKGNDVNIGVVDDGNVGMKGNDVSIGVVDDVNLSMKGNDVNIGVVDDVNLSMKGNDVNIGVVDDVNLGMKGNDVNIGVVDNVNLDMKGNDVNIGVMNLDMKGNDVNIGVADDVNIGVVDDVNIGVVDDVNLGMKGDDVNIGVNDDANVGMKVDDVNISANNDANVGRKGDDVNIGAKDDANVGMKGDGDDGKIRVKDDVNVSVKGDDVNISMDEDVNVGMKSNDVNVSVEDDMNIIAADDDMSMDVNDVNMGGDGSDMDIVVDCSYGGHEVEEPNIGLSLGLDSFEHEQLAPDEVIDFAVCKDDQHESGQWLLQPCNNQDIRFDCDDEEEKQEEKQEEKEDQLLEQEEQHVGFTLLSKCKDSIETSFIEEIEASQVPCSSRMQLRSHTSNVQQQYASSNQANLVLGEPSVFGKREADHDHDEEISHKRLRSENEPWSQQSLSDFDVCMENIQHYLGKSKRLYQEKEQISTSSSVNQELMMGEIQQRDEMIERLHKLRYDELQNHRMDIYKLERELFGMNDLLKGYRKALKDTRHSFAEYRKRVNLPEEPLYKDVPGSGGLMLSATDLEKYLLKQKEEERIKRREIEFMVAEFEKEWTEIFSEFHNKTNMLDEKLMDIEKMAKGVFSERKGPFLAEVAAVSPPTE